MIIIEIKNRPDDFLLYLVPLLPRAENTLKKIVVTWAVRVKQSAGDKRKPGDSALITIITTRSGAPDRNYRTFRLSVYKFT